MEEASTYRVVPPPRFAWMREWDCEICGCETLKRPVFLAGVGGPVAAGTGCAARLLGREPRYVTKQRDALLAEAVRMASELEARAARYEAALGEYRRYGREVVGRHEADFNRLRVEHSRQDPSLRPPAAFALYLEQRLEQLASE